MDGMGDAATLYRKSCVAGLVRALVKLKPLTAEGKHLWHEGHAFDAAGAIEGRENFIFGADLDPIAHTKGG